MKKIICTFISIALLSVLSTVSASAQTFGLRVEANIPFDFIVGKQAFKAGSYELSIVENRGGVYTVSLKDDDGRSIYRTFALRTNKTAAKDTRMEFAVVGDERYLETIKTPDVGYAFTRSHSNKAIAQVNQISVPTSISAPQF